MPAREVWDAYDACGNRLGYDLYRDEDRQIPPGVYHIVAEVYAITTNKEVLITQRHPDKAWPLKWEITGGSILKGETPEEGALRELKEETGIIAQKKDLRFIYSYNAGSALDLLLLCGRHRRRKHANQAVRG